MPLLNLDETQLPPPPAHTWWCGGHRVDEPKDGWDDATPYGVYHRCRLAFPAAKATEGGNLETHIERTSWFDWETEPDRPQVRSEEPRICIGWAEMTADQAEHFAKTIMMAVATIRLAGTKPEAS